MAHKISDGPLFENAEPLADWHDTKPQSRAEAVGNVLGHVAAFVLFYLLGLAVAVLFIVGASMAWAASPVVTVATVAAALAVVTVSLVGRK